MKKGSQADETGLIKIGDHLVLVGEHDVLDYGRDEMIELIKNDLNTFGSVRLCFHSATSGGNQHGMGGEPGQTDEIQIKINKKELLKSSKTYDNVTKRNSIEFDDYINILQVLDKRFDSTLKETIVFAMYDVDGDGRIGVDDLVYVLTSIYGRSCPGRYSTSEIAYLAEDSLKTMNCVDGYLNRNTFISYFGSALLQLLSMPPHKFSK